MVIFRDRRVVAFLRDDEPVGSLLLRLFRLSREKLRGALVELDASIVRAQRSSRCPQFLADRR